MVTMLVTAALGVVPGAASAMTRERARGVVRAVNLTQDDMLGFDAVAGESADELRKDEACLDLTPRRRALALGESPFFNRTDAATFIGVQSVVTVMPNATMAAHDVRAFRTKRTRHCLLAVLRDVNDLSDFSASVTPVQPLTTGEGALRLTLTFTDHGVKTRVTSRYRLIARGPVEILLATTAGGQSFPLDRERALEQVLVSRAEQQLAPVR